MISAFFVVLISFLAGMDGILDEFQFQQPIVAATLIGLANGHVTEGIILGGTLQMLALGWMNIGAAVAPDAALASVVSAYLVTGPAQVSVYEGMAIAVPLAIAGQVLTIGVRTLTVVLAHVADRQAEKGSLRGLDAVNMAALTLQGLRIAIPTIIVIAVGAGPVNAALNAIPDVITKGLAVAGGFIVVVGYAMVINMMATPELWPFFFLGFALSAVTELNLIAMGIIGLVLALIYLQLSPRFNGGNDGGGSEGGSSSGSSGDQIDAILNNY
ncbi:PTS mannose/fructose/sorbose transporter subunit IIC [Weissella viridescens]|uniref:PTS family mannose fructose sorbose porter component IIC n=1 Tax=Weissella viridescens TaxID=1629 RepID=A0A0R2HBH5_WEIVI|nr:PTS mannose/fructose/sorbose transporter subunit IIC [Weissella viridescens]KRN47239.1 PTS family mannose fructose sorbose porter component IIC [Weissella viridescens]MBX4172020.1 PTS mannose/fructose/sorbose transporter subunit IIC [Weissella viridescens]MCB6840947.1 PTS mannose/fructose/sorbose transporter subunit IIC [Weissella viridescens]MCB6847665.1 PTS mannose/fructose/sorbose transporter subunit IIC [Weissella viridescens]QOD85789.1 PTS mannose/fructose/sorbose transporter subunit I